MNESTDRVFRDASVSNASVCIGAECRFGGRGTEHFLEHKPGHRVGCNIETTVISNNY